MWTYSQITGALRDAEGAIVAIGYAGHGEGKNDPEAQHIRNVGPLPRGLYRIGDAIAHRKLGPASLPLTPDAGNVMHGRSGFYIHGDSIKAPGTASTGCIILAADVRARIAGSRDRWLVVLT